MGIAQCIIEELNRFNEFQYRDLNNHAPSLDGYRRMLPVFEAIQSSSLYRENVSIEELISILGERIHPNHRTQTIIF